MHVYTRRRAHETQGKWVCVLFERRSVAGADDEWSARGVLVQWRALVPNVSCERVRQRAEGVKGNISE